MIYEKRRLSPIRLAAIGLLLVLIAIAVMNKFKAAQEQPYAERGNTLRSVVEAQQAHEHSVAR